METANSIIITIDGPAGSGKSTLAQGLAEALGITCLNSGAIYRALALKALNNGIDPTSESDSLVLLKDLSIKVHPPVSLEQKFCVTLNGEDVTDHLWANEVSIAASKISKHPKIREKMVELQRKIADDSVKDQTAKGNELVGIVIEGRDAGTVVFPKAKVKFFLVAKIDERAKRRMNDFGDGEVSLEKARDEIMKRDLADETRAASPLIPAEGSIVLDNTDWDKDETLMHAVEAVEDKLGIEVWY
ncbi:MAG TPA: (d)CMP kinase [bacterium]|jgi:cytidylate kinase